jgi:hypothetical protein
MTRPALVRLLPDQQYDVSRLKLVCYTDPDGWEYEGGDLCLGDWFAAGGRYRYHGPVDAEPVFEATSVFPRGG